MLQLERQVDLGSACHILCQYKDHTYVALHDGGGIDRIDDQGNVTSQFIKTSGTVVSIRAHNDRLYSLVKDRSAEAILGLISIREPKLCVHDMKGQLITAWDHADILFTGLQGNRIGIIEEKIAVMDAENHRITHYMPNGDIARHISCPQINIDCKAMCEAGGGSVIITDCALSKVFKLSLKSGELEWLSEHVREPLGVICYGEDYVLVTSGYHQVWILNIADGEWLVSCGISP